MACLLLAISAVALALTPARAESRSAVVMVSVHVVESCRVETDGTVASNSVALKMRCSSTARPNVNLVDSSRTVPAVSSLTVPRSQLAVSDNGPTLSIQF
jgi:hypothetical protein